MKLLIDMDIITYHACFSAEGDTISGVVEKLNSIMSSILDATEVPCEYQGYLTGTGNFRHELSDIYKAQRPKEKPIYHKFARQYLIDNWGAIVVDGQEADDAIAIEATRLGFDNVIIVSIDKDFKQLPCMIYNYQKQTWHQSDEWQASVNFYTQILVGDASDNIKGVRGIGPVTAAKLFVDCKTEQDLYQTCLKAYEGKSATSLSISEAKEEVLKSGRLLWLRREEGQMWEPPSLVGNPPV